MDQSSPYVVSRVGDLVADGWDRARVEAAVKPVDFTGLRVVSGEPVVDRASRIHCAWRVAPGGGVLSGWAAAALHGVPESFLDGTTDGSHRIPVEFSVPRDGGTYPRRGLRARYTRVLPDDVVEIDGMRATSRRRTALDLARWSRTAHRCLAMLDLSMRHGLVDPASLADYVRPLKGLHGLKRVRSVMGEMCAAAESVPESELRWTWLCNDLPRPVPNASVDDRFGDFAGRIDLFDAETGFGAEYQGFWHALDGAPDSDAQRFAKFSAMNMTIVPIWKKDVVAGQVGSLLVAGYRAACRRDRNLDSWRMTPQNRGSSSPRSPEQKH